MLGYTITIKVYEYARWFWAFKSVTTTGTGQTISPLQQQDANHNAVLGVSNQ